MKLLTFDKGKMSTALLSACLAGGIVTYSTAVSASESDVDKHYAEAKVHQQAKADEGERDNNGPPFHQVDQNRSFTLSWRELRAIYRDELDQVGWNEEYVLETYDSEGNGALDEEEYLGFVSGLMTEMMEHANPPSEDDAMAEMQDEYPRPEAMTDRRLSTSTSGEEPRRRREAAARAEGLSALSEHSNEEIERREVINAEGDALGDVSSVVSAPDGSITGLVVGVGGFWGIGKKNVFAPLDELHVAGDYIIWRTTLDEQQLENIPHYQLNEDSGLAP